MHFTGARPLLLMKRKFERDACLPTPPHPSDLEGNPFCAQLDRWTDAKQKEDLRRNKYSSPDQRPKQKSKKREELEDKEDGDL